MGKKQVNSFAWNETIQKLFEIDKGAVDSEIEKFTSNRVDDITPDEDFKNIVDGVADSTTSYEVLHDGEILEDSGEYDTYYSDCPGGEFTQLKIVKHKGKIYVYKEKVVEDRELNQKRECVAFYELK